MELIKRTYNNIKTDRENKLCIDMGGGVVRKRAVAGRPYERKLFFIIFFNNHGGIRGRCCCVICCEAVCKFCEEYDLRQTVKKCIINIRESRRCDGL